jgi:hypothetical protein
MCLSPIENGTARRRCRFIFGRINRGDGRNAQIAAMIGGGGIIQDTRRPMARNGANAPSRERASRADLHSLLKHWSTSKDDKGNALGPQPARTTGY